MALEFPLRCFVECSKRGGEYKQAARWIEDNLSRRLLVYKTLGR